MVAIKRDESSFLLFHAYISEVQLESELRAICLRHRVTLRDVYLDIRQPSAHAARLEVWWWMVTKIQKSPREVARIFHRDGSSILYALRRLHERADMMMVVLTEETINPVSKAVAQSYADAKVLTGEAAAQLNNLGKSVGRNRKK